MVASDSAGGLSSAEGLRGDLVSLIGWLWAGAWPEVGWPLLAVSCLGVLASAAVSLL